LSPTFSRRKAIYEELHPDTKHGGGRKGDQVANFATRFTSDTAEGTGKSERAIRLAAARGEALGDDLTSAFFKCELGALIL
jgi:ParB family chromosome partitioning protein